MLGRLDRSLLFSRSLSIQDNSINVSWHRQLKQQSFDVFGRHVITCKESLIDIIDYDVWGWHYGLHVTRVKESEMVLWSCPGISRDSLLLGVRHSSNLREASIVEVKEEHVTATTEAVLLGLEDTTAQEVLILLLYTEVHVSIYHVLQLV